MLPVKPHVVVLGLGIAGSSIAAGLAERGFRVTGIEQFSPLHERGSSHGDTRIFRRVPHEGEVYVSLAASSYDGWRAWNGIAAEPLLMECGGVDAGPEWSTMVRSAEELCRGHEQPFEVFSGSGFNARYPHFRLPSDWRVVYQPRSGFVRPDATRVFLHAAAREHGALLLHHTAVLCLDSHANGVTVRAANATIAADFVVAASGSWLPHLFPELALPLISERRVIAWFPPLEQEEITGGRLPIFVLDADGGWYGMPTPDGRVKIGHDKHRRQRTDPNAPSTQADGEDEAFLSSCVRTYLAGFHDRPTSMKPCLYTLSADRHFLIDRHPRDERVLLFSCCSGHGFKYAPVYGEIAADLIEGRLRDDLAAFRLKRDGATATRFSD